MDTSLWHPPFLFQLHHRQMRLKENHVVINLDAAPVSLPVVFQRIPQEFLGDFQACRCVMPAPASVLVGMHQSGQADKLVVGKYPAQVFFLAIGIVALVDDIADSSMMVAEFFGQDAGLLCLGQIGVQGDGAVAVKPFDPITVKMVVYDIYTILAGVVL